MTGKGKLLIFTIVLIALACTVTLCTGKNPSSPGSDNTSIPNVDVAKNTILGFSISPAHMPDPGDKDINDYFNLAAQSGSHVTLITEWKDEMPTDMIKQLMEKTRAKHLAFHLYLSPISLDGGRKTPAIPTSVGGTSFKDEKVRAAFKARALELASLKPDYLGLGTEVNFLEANPAEYEAYVSLTKETYQAIKEKYPDQTVTISFQWDNMIINKRFDSLARFNQSLDVYSFTTYPSFFGDPDMMPVEYYSCIRKLLPTQRLGFSEVGWNSKAGSSEEMQAKFYAKLPELMKNARPEYVTLGLMHDVTVFSPELNALNSVGVRNLDGTPKKSWNVVSNLTFG